MNILVGLSPFITFAVLSNLSVDLALWLAFAAAFAIGIRHFVQRRALSILDAGGTLLFGLLALYAGFVAPGIATKAVRLAVDAGFLGMALTSLLFGSPFTLPHASEPPSRKGRAPPPEPPGRMLTVVWLLAFAIMTLGDAAAAFDKRFPLSLDSAIELGALAIAIAFTARFAVREKTHAPTARRSAAAGPRSSI
jgi:hypothetical protein